MFVRNLTENSVVYTSNVYLVTGSDRKEDCRNTLIDVGRDPVILTVLMDLVHDKKPLVEQVFLTHFHYDHVSMLPALIDRYHPDVYAFSDNLDGVTHIIRDGDVLTVGDQEAEVIHLGGHTYNSLCLYCREEKALFVGDNTLYIGTATNSFERQFVEAYQRICEYDIAVIYPGHGCPLTNDCNRLLKESLSNVLSSHINDDM